MDARPSTLARQFEVVFHVELKYVHKTYVSRILVRRGGLLELFRVQRIENAKASPYRRWRNLGVCDASSGWRIAMFCTCGQSFLPGSDRRSSVLLEPNQCLYARQTDFISNPRLRQCECVLT
jgi:hypothetical protein